jgi:hypothetical protein
VIRLPSIALALTLGCAHTPDVHDAIDGGQIALGFIRESAKPLEEIHHAATDAAIAYCRALADDTAESRRECLERVGFSPKQIDEYETALEAVSKAYDAIAESLDAIEKAWPVLERLKERAEALPK